VALGDFNMTPLSLAHRLVTAHGGVVDAWRVVHPHSATGAAADRPDEFRGVGVGDSTGVPSAAYNLAVNGTTCDSALNTWRWDKRLRGKRLVLRQVRDMPLSSPSSLSAQAQAQRLPDAREEEDEEEAGQKVGGRRGSGGRGVLGRRGEEDAPEAEEQKPKGRPAWRRWWWGWWELQKKKNAERKGRQFGGGIDVDGDVVVVDPEQLPDPWGKRLDYIFVGQPEQRCCTPVRGCGGGGGGCVGGGGYYWRVDKVACGMITPHPTLGCSLSDHFSVEATLCLTPLTSDAAAAQKSPDDHRSCGSGGGGGGGGSGGKDSHSPASPLPPPPPPPPPPLPPSLLPPSTYDEILAMIAAYTARERRQRRLRLAHFGVQTLVTLGCLVGVWWLPLSWQPSWLEQLEQQGQQQRQQHRRQRVSVAACVFALMLLAVLGFAAGLLDGLIGGLFVSAELRALREFEWEIRNARAQAVAAAAAVGEAAQGAATGGGARDVSGVTDGDDDGDSDAEVGAG
jgi:hypothetical protein